MFNKFSTMSFSDFSKAYKSIETDATDKDVKDAFNTGDADHDNRMTFKEFDKFK